MYSSNTIMKAKDQFTSILLPCLNESSSIIRCVTSIIETVRESNYPFELIIIDNSSTDDTLEKAAFLKEKYNEVEITHEARRGYGSAYMQGFEQAKGTNVIMLDCDNTYDVSKIPLFISALQSGTDFVIGDRFSGGIEKGAMPFLHQYVGNPFLSSLVRIFFGTRVRDVHCGLRGISMDAYKIMNLQTIGMEFASEMIIKAVKRDLTIEEIPVPYAKRTGESKLRSFADGWRHLRFILLYSPMIIFLVPGAILLVTGIIAMGLLYFDSFIVLGRQFMIHPSFIFSLAIISGFQLISFAGFAKAYAVTHLNEESHILESIMNRITIEKALIFGSFVVLTGIILFIVVLKSWIDADFKGITDQIKTSIVALTAIVLGIQIISNAFMTSILGIQEK